MALLDFKKQEKGYKKFYPTRENIKANIGKRICYVNYVEPYRGTYFVRYGVIYALRYSRVFLSEDFGVEVHIRGIIECGIEIEQTEPQ
jgi:hypothetical protein